MIFPLTGEVFDRELETYKKKVSECMIESLKRLEKIFNSSAENFNQDQIKKILDSPVDSIEEYQEFGAIKEKISKEGKAQLEEDLKVIKKCFRNMDSESISLGARLYQDYCIKSKDGVKRYKHLRDYVQLHGKMKPSDGIIDALYERYMYEIAQVIVYLSYRTLKEKMSTGSNKISPQFMEYFVNYLRSKKDKQ